MAGLKILIVEDEIIVAEDLRQSLNQQGYTVTGIARFGAEALLLATFNPPDLALVDLELSGGLDGLTTAKLLSEHANDNLHIIFITSMPGQLNNLMLRVLTKPFTSQDLNQQIQSCSHPSVD